MFSREKMKKLVLTEKFMNLPIQWEQKRAIINTLFGIEDAAKPVNLDLLNSKAEYGVWLEEDKSYVDIDTKKSHPILEAYNLVKREFFRRKKQYAPLDTTSTPTNYKDILNLINFLEAHRITDYYLYFYTLFASTNWGAAWGIKACHSPKALDMFVSWKEKYQSEIERNKQVLVNQMEENKSRTDGTKQNSWVSTYNHIEEMKQRLVSRGQEEVCLGRQDDFLGYHPLSAVCTACRLKGECAKQIYLNFQRISNSNLDILQIRSGEVSVSEATRQLRSSGNGFDFYI